MNTLYNLNEVSIESYFQNLAYFPSINEPGYLKLACTSRIDINNTNVYLDVQIDKNGFHIAYMTELHASDINMVKYAIVHLSNMYNKKIEKYIDTLDSWFIEHLAAETELFINSADYLLDLFKDNHISDFWNRPDIIMIRAISKRIECKHKFKIFFDYCTLFNMNITASDAMVLTEHTFNTDVMFNKQEGLKLIQSHKLLTQKNNVRSRF